MGYDGAFLGQDGFAIREVGAMEWSGDIGAFLADDRLLANLIAVHAALLALLVVSFVVRQVVQRGGQRFLSWFGVSWLRGVTEEATGAARQVVYWATLAAMAASIVGGIVYHFAGRDIRLDGAALWNKHFTADDAFGLGVVFGKLCGVAIATWVACRLVRRLRYRLEAYAQPLLPAGVEELGRIEATPDDNSEANDDAAADLPAEPPSNVRRWFNLLERFAVALIVLGGAWLAARIAKFGALELCVRFVMPLLSAAFLARLLTLSVHSLSRGLANVGDRRLSGPSMRRYWERAKRLFPFGEKCFEAVVYVWAAASILTHLGWHLPKIEIYSDRVIACIGIFFATRVVIELLHVLVNEAFGMFDERRQVDQKGQTLVPLLQSLIQYVLYFGSFVVMLEVLQGPTNTILAGAGLLGLAVGLGAQSLVSDVVSGFFILFEGQYLVGDIVQIGDANGRVEVVSIRHTQIRDEQGKITIIPNGQIKSVTNYSKGWVNAVVDIKAPTTANLEGLMKDMAEAGRRLKLTRREVMADTVVKGLVDLSPSEMTVRAVTKVMPGTHATMQCEYRKLLKDVMDQRSQKAAA
jgi:small-conductance mechanosensitive channel